MKVSEYRDMMSELSDLFASLRSAATPAERVSEAWRVRSCARRLQRAECPRAKFADLSKAARLVDLTTKYLEESGLGAELARRDEHDHGLGDLPYPPEYPKMPGEPKRVQPSRARKEGPTTP